MTDKKDWALKQAKSIVDDLQKQSVTEEGLTDSAMSALLTQALRETREKALEECSDALKMMSCGCQRHIRALKDKSDE